MGWSPKQSRYDLMDFCQTENETYPDCLSIDSDDLSDLQLANKELVYQGDVIRPDLFFYRKMGTNNLEDIVLWANGIASRRDLVEGQALQLPRMADINAFFIKHRKVR